MKCLLYRYVRGASSLVLFLVPKLSKGPARPGDCAIDLLEVERHISFYVLYLLPCRDFVWALRVVLTISTQVLKSLANVMSNALQRYVSHSFLKKYMVLWKQAIVAAATIFNGLWPSSACSAIGTNEREYKLASHSASLVALHGGLATIQADMWSVTLLFLCCWYTQEFSPNFVLFITQLL